MSTRRGAAPAASIDGEATYRERIAPPNDAVLVVTLEDSARADAPATEIASTRMRIGGGPPYRWRIEYDARLIGPQARPMLRPRLETPQGLWMTTDTANPAFTEPRLLQLRPVPRPDADNCTVAAMTQAARADGAHQEFLEDASASLSAQLMRIESGLPAPRQAAWRRLQKSWLDYRTEACSFESGASARGQCTADAAVALCRPPHARPRHRADAGGKLPRGRPGLHAAGAVAPRTDRPLLSQVETHTAAGSIVTKRLRQPNLSRAN